MERLGVMARDGFVDDPAWIASGKHTLWNAARHHATCPNHRPIANGCSWTDDCSTADPNVFPDRDRRTELQPESTFCGRKWVRGGINVDSGAQERVTADTNGIDVQEDAVYVDINIATEHHVVSVVAMEWGLNVGIGFRPEELGKQGESCRAVG